MEEKEKIAKLIKELRKYTKEVQSFRNSEYYHGIKEMTDISIQKIVEIFNVTAQPLENEQKYNTPFGKIIIQSIDAYANNSGKIYTISDYGIMIFNTKEFIQNIILQKFLLIS